MALPHVRSLEEHARGADAERRDPGADTIRSRKTALRERSEALQRGQFLRPRGDPEGGPRGDRFACARFRARGRGMPSRPCRRFEPEVSRSPRRPASGGRARARDRQRGDSEKVEQGDDCRRLPGGRLFPSQKPDLSPGLRPRRAPFSSKGRVGGRDAHEHRSVFPVGRGDRLADSDASRQRHPRGAPATRPVPAPDASGFGNGAGRFLRR